MKNTRLTSILSSGFIACALMLGSLASTQSASAQITTMAEVNIPFSFQTQTQTFPAGAYRIDRHSARIVRLQGPGHAAGFVNTYNAVKSQPVEHGYLVFDHYGDKYFLRQIWTVGSKDGLECPKSHAEKAALVATNDEAVSTVELAFNSAPQNQNQK
jgi:hypothetical protein